MTIRRFNIRVYGLLLHEGRVLVADETIQGMRVTKFPGGGLEFGEGTRDGLVREIQEEMGVEALDLVHYYTTDFFQPSAYREGDQIISIYYTFRVARPDELPTTAIPFDSAFAAESFRWLDLHTARPEDATLPIDRVVLKMLLGDGTP